MNKWLIGGAAAAMCAPLLWVIAVPLLMLMMLNSPATADQICGGQLSSDTDQQPSSSQTSSGALNANQMRDLIRQHLPDAHLGEAMAVAKCESGWDPNAHNYDRPTGTSDWGVFQLNDGGTLQAALHAIDVQFRDLKHAQRLARTPEINIRAAAHIYSQRKWQAWACASPQHLGLTATRYGHAPGPNVGHYDRNGEHSQRVVNFNTGGRSTADLADILGVGDLDPDAQSDVLGLCAELGNSALPGQCGPTPWPQVEAALHPNARTGMRCAYAMNPDIAIVYGKDPRPDGGDHPLGLAVDLMVPSSNQYPFGCKEPTGTPPEYEAKWTKLATHFMDNATAYGVSYVIWRQRIWNPSRDQPKPHNQWRTQTSRGSCNSDHYNHIHLSFKPELAPGPQGSAGGKFRPVSGKWTWPLHHPTYGNGRDFGEDRPRYRHAGEDMVPKPGTSWDLYAIGSGKVLQARYQVDGGGIGYGFNVIIAHDNGYQSQYAHMARYTVTAGQQVKTGQKIGEMGDSGSPGSYHLHLNIASPGNDPNNYPGNVDPWAYLMAAAGKP